MDNVDYFASNVKFLRIKRGFKQKEICDQLGFVQATWSEYEHGWSKPRYDDLLKIIAFFDITASELMEMDLEKGNPNDILQLRKIVKKGKAKGKGSGSLNYENTNSEWVLNEDETKVNSDVLDQLNRMEAEIKKMRSKLGR